MKLCIVFLKITVYFIFFVILVCITLIINGLYRSYGPCVKLPNGIIVAREAYISFEGYYFTPNVVVKGPDGTIFSRGNDEIFYFSETTAYWVDIHPRELSERSEALAYRPDVGLVSAWKDRTLYEQLKREAGPLLEEGNSLKNSNILYVWHELLKYPQYYSRNCNIPLFTFEKSYP